MIEEYVSLEEVKVLQDYIKETYVKMKDSSNVTASDDTLTPQRINYCLAFYTEVSNQLLFDYRQELDKLNYYKQQFNNWQKEKFVLARDKLNADRTKSKFASQSEIEAEAFVDNKKEWKEWEQKIFFIEAKSSILHGLRENWKSHSFMLKEISDNMKVEMHNLSMERIMEKPTNKVIKPLSKRVLE
jgi:hypothetical protein